MPSKAKHLPIYKKSYELIELITVRVKNFPRNYRHTIGRKLQDEAAELALCVYKANAARNKIPYIDLIFEKVLSIEMMAQLSFDLRILPSKAYAEAIEITGNLLSQAGGWKKYAERNTLA